MMKIQVNISKLAILVILLSLSYSAIGQSQGYQEEITVVAPYEPTISDAYKINLRAQTGDSIPEKKNFSYEIRSKVLPTPFELLPLRPARLVGEPLEKLYKNYLRAGFGTYTTPLFEYHYNSLRSKSTNYGLRVKHLSSSGKIEDYGFPGMSNNELGFYYQKIGRKGNTLATKVGYSRDVVHFYGFRTDILEEQPEKDDYKQRYSDIRAAFSWYSHEPDIDKLRHKISLDISLLNDKFKTSELEMNFMGRVYKNMDVFDFSDVQEIGLQVSTDFYKNIQLDSSLGSSAVISMEPQFRTEINEFEISIGAKADIGADTSTRLTINPTAEIRIHVLESALNIFFGTEAGMSRNSYHSYVRENPFISDSIPMGFQEEKYRFYGGVEGRLGQRISFNATITASKSEGMPFFVNDTNYQPASRFTAFVQEASIFNVSGTFVYQHSSKWKARAMASFDQYSVAEQEAWHKPDLTGSIAILYNLRDKLIFETEILAEGKRKARVFDEEGKPVAKTLDGFMDINLGFEYRYSKILSAFIHLNNIAGNKYERWLNYPKQGFRLMGGLSYSF